MAKGGGWRRTGRLDTGAVARKAIPVWVCAKRGCEVHHQGRWDVERKRFIAPVHCLDCGGIEFDRFDSTGEANQWASYRLQERTGLISNLQRQVRFPLLTIGPKGQPVEWAAYVADYQFDRKGENIVADFKPNDGITREAELKLRCLEAQGTKVLIVTNKGEI